MSGSSHWDPSFGTSNHSSNSTGFGNQVQSTPSVSSDMSATSTMLQPTTQPLIAAPASSTLCTAASNNQQNSNICTCRSQRTTSVLEQVQKPAGSGFNITATSTPTGPSQEHVWHASNCIQINGTTSIHFSGIPNDSTNIKIIGGEMIESSQLTVADTIVEEGGAPNIVVHYSTITFRTLPENKSLKELRLEDYQAALRTIQRRIDQTANLNHKNKTRATEMTGTKRVKFRPIADTDTTVKNGLLRNILIQHQYIVSMMEYVNKSFDELRFEDYQNSLRTFDVDHGNTNTATEIIGTKTVKFRPVADVDTTLRNGWVQNISTRHQYIASMREYANKSCEELRLEDYDAGVMCSQGQICGPSCKLAKTPPLAESSGASDQPIGRDLIDSDRPATMAPAFDTPAQTAVSPTISSLQSPTSSETLNSVKKTDLKCALSPVNDSPAPVAIDDGIQMVQTSSPSPSNSPLGEVVPPKITVTPSTATVTTTSVIGGVTSTLLKPATTNNDLSLSTSSSKSTFCIKPVSTTSVSSSKPKTQISGLCFIPSGPFYFGTANGSDTVTTSARISGNKSDSRNISKISLKSKTQMKPKETGFLFLKPSRTPILTLGTNSHTHTTVSSSLSRLVKQTGGVSSRIPPVSSFGTTTASSTVTIKNSARLTERNQFPGKTVTTKNPARLTERNQFPCKTVTIKNVARLTERNQFPCKTVTIKNVARLTERNQFPCKTVTMKNPAQLTENNKFPCKTVTTKNPARLTERNQLSCRTVTTLKKSLDFVTISNTKTSLPEPTLKAVTQRTEFSATKPPMMSTVVFKTTTATNTPLSSTSSSSVAQSSGFSFTSAPTSTVTFGFGTTSIASTPIKTTSTQSTQRNKFLVGKPPPLSSTAAAFGTASNPLISSIPFPSVTSGGFSVKSVPISTAAFDFKFSVGTSIPVMSTISSGTTSTTSASFISTPLQSTTQSGEFSFGIPPSLSSTTTAAFGTPSNVNKVFSTASSTSSAQSTGFSVTKPPMTSTIAFGTASDTNTQFSTTPFPSVTQDSGFSFRSAPTSTVTFGFPTTSPISTPILQTAPAPSPQDIKPLIGTFVPLTSTVSGGTASNTSASFFSTLLQTTTQSGGFSFGIPLSLPSTTTAAFGTPSNVDTVFSTALLTSSAQSTVANKQFSCTPFPSVTQDSGFSFRLPSTSTVTFGFPTTSTISTPILQTAPAPSPQDIKPLIGTFVPLASTVSGGTTSTRNASFFSNPLQSTTQSGGFSFGIPFSLPSTTTAAFGTPSNVNTVFSTALLTPAAQNTGFFATKPPMMSPVAFGTTSATNTPFSSTPISSVTQGSGFSFKSAPTSTIAFGFGTTSTTSTPIETISTPPTQSIKFSVGTNIPLTSPLTITSPSFFSTSLASTTQCTGFSFRTPLPLMTTAAFGTSCNTSTIFSPALSLPTTQSTEFSATSPMTPTIALQSTTQSQGFSFGTPRSIPSTTALASGTTLNTSTTFSTISPTVTNQCCRLFIGPSFPSMSTAFSGMTPDTKVFNTVSTPTTQNNGFSSEPRLLSTSTHCAGKSSSSSRQDFGNVAPSYLSFGTPSPSSLSIQHPVLPMFGTPCSFSKPFGAPSPLMETSDSETTSTIVTSPSNTAPMSFIQKSDMSLETTLPSTSIVPFESTSDPSPAFSTTLSTPATESGGLSFGTSIPSTTTTVSAIVADTKLSPTAAKPETRNSQLGSETSFVAPSSPELNALNGSATATSYTGAHEKTTGSEDNMSIDPELEMNSSKSDSPHLA